MQNLTEDKVLLEAELNQLRVPDVNVNQRGNSLFAEVEDKRQSTAKNLEVMKIKYNKLSQKYTQAHEELKKLKVPMYLFYQHLTIFTLSSGLSWSLN